MRRAVAIWSIWMVLVLAGLVGVTALRVGPGPDLDGIEAQVTVSGDGTAYLVENEEEGYRIYGVDEGGSVVYYYSGRSREERIGSVGVGRDGTLYVVLEGKAASENGRNSWRVLELTAEGRAQTLFYGDTSVLAEVDRVTAEGEELYLSGVSGSGGGQITYGVSLPVEVEADTGTVEMVQVCVGGVETIELCYSGSTGYGIQQDGGGAAIRRTGLSRYTEPAEAVYTGVWTDGGVGYLYNSVSGGVYEDAGQALQLRAQVEAGTAVKAGAGGRTSGLVLLVQREDVGTVLVREREGALVEYEGLNVPIKMQVRRMGTEFMTWGLLAVCGLVVLTVAVVIYRKSRRLAVKLGMAAAGSVVVITLVLSGIVCFGTREQIEGSRVSAAAAYGELRANDLEAVDLTGLTEGTFYGSDVYNSLLDQLAEQQVEVEGQRVSLRSELLMTDGGEVKVAVAAGKQYGAAVEALYEAPLLELIAAGAAGESRMAAVEANGEKRAVSVQPVEQGGVVVGVLLTELSMTDLSVGMRNTLIWMWVIGLGVSVVAAGLIFLVSNGALRPMRRISKQMDRMADGEFALSGEVRTENDEVGSIWRALKELSVSLAIREYETENMLKSYYRFVPRGINQLLDKVSIMDVLFGDVTRAEGNLSIVTVQNRDEVRRRLDDNGFMDFVNDSFTAINSSVTKYGGMLLSGDFDLAGVRALYPESAEEAMMACVDLCGDMKRKGKDPMAPQLFVILHAAMFLFGIAGTEEKAFPFLASSELDFLNGYAEHFSRTGTRMVITGQVREKMRGQVPTRYIGFVSSPDGRYTFKLYEALAVYPDTQRLQLEQQDGKFQEGLQLFYKNDFYLARNIFSGILKACPDDGIARWYMFACERLFNSGDLEHIRYDLFGSER